MRVYALQRGGKVKLCERKMNEESDRIEMKLNKNEKE